MISDEYIEYARCRNCDKNFPVYKFVGDTDMGMDSWRAFTNRQTGEVLVQREPKDLTRSPDAEYTEVHVKYYQPYPELMDCDFPEWSKSRSTSVPVYECIHCGGEAFPTHKESKQEFMFHSNINEAGAT